MPVEIAFWHRSFFAAQTPLAASAAFLHPADADTVAYFA
jgi:hypothetical protein